MVHGVLTNSQTIAVKVGGPVDGCHIHVKCLHTDTDRQTYRQIGGQTDRQTDRLTVAVKVGGPVDGRDIQVKCLHTDTDRQIDRQTDRHTHRQTD